MGTLPGRLKMSQLSARKRLAKPILFGTLLFGLGTAFFNRQWFFQDLEELKAKEQARYEAQLIEVMEERQRVLAEAARKKGEINRTEI